MRKKRHDPTPYSEEHGLRLPLPTPPLPDHDDPTFEVTPEGLAYLAEVGGGLLED